MARFASLLTLLAAVVAADAGAAPLTVVGFNVQSDNSSDIVIGRQLERSSDIDLWGLTEIYRRGGWVEKMQAAAGVGEAAQFGAVVGTTGSGNESLILYRSDRLRLLGSEELVDLGGGRRDPAPLVARFRLDDGQQFLFVVVRLSNRDSRRLEQARGLADWGARQELPVIALGTFAFGVPEGGANGDEAMSVLTDETGWRWVRPPDAFATACGRPRLVQDFVFAGGAARDWAGQATVTFRQSNYCNSSDSDRGSDFRPVVAGFRTEGGPGGIAGAMPERQVPPFLPAGVAMTEVREARDDAGRTGRASGSGELPPLATEAGAPPPAAGSADPTPPPTAPISPPVSAPIPQPAPAPPPSAVTAPPAAPPAAVSAPAVAPAPVPEPASPAPDPEREALLKRLEALEREAREIRRALESE